MLQAAVSHSFKRARSIRRVGRLVNPHRKFSSEIELACEFYSLDGARRAELKVTECLKQYSRTMLLNEIHHQQRNKDNQHQSREHGNRMQTPTRCSLDGLHTLNRHRSDR